MRWVLGVAALGLGLGAGVWTALGGPSSGADPAAVLSPATLGATGSGAEESAAELLGITAAVSVPRRILEQQRPGPEQLALTVRADAQMAASLGARWVRAHSGNWPFVNHHEMRNLGFDGLDLWVQVVQEAGMQGLVMISPWPGERTGDYTTSYPPVDEGAYTAWVRQVVERYDGDGVDDMPGLRGPIRHWEIDNEPDIKNSLPAKGSKREYDPSTFCTPQEYARVLVATARAVKQADPNAVVLNGGFYRPQTASGLKYMQDVFAQPGVAEAVDVLNVHLYSNESSVEPLRRGVQNVRALGLDRPLWLTEISVPSKAKEEWVTETWQAEMVPRLITEAVRLGVERLFWHTLADPPEEVTSRTPPGQVSNFWFHSLCRMRADGGYTVKPAGVAWRVLAQRMAGVPRSSLHAESWGLRVGEDRVLLDGELRLEAPPRQAIRLRDGREVQGAGGGLRFDASDGALLIVP